MIPSVDLFHQLQNDVTNSTIPVSDLLRKAKRLATRLDLKVDLVWINRELEGYLEVSVDEVPKYRFLTGQPTIKREIILTDNPKFCIASETSPIWRIEQRCKNIGDYGVLGYRPEIEAELLKEKNYPLTAEVALCVRHDTVLGILHGVKSRISDWCMELEESGIIGEEMGSQRAEKNNQSSMTVIINNSTVHSLNNASGQDNKVENIQETPPSQGFAGLIKKIWNFFRGFWN